MNDKNKTKTELIAELAALRQRVGELEKQSRPSAAPAESLNIAEHNQAEQSFPITRKAL